MFYLVKFLIYPLLKYGIFERSGDKKVKKRTIGIIAT